MTKRSRLPGGRQAEELATLLSLAAAADESSPPAGKGVSSRSRKRKPKPRKGVSTLSLFLFAHGVERYMQAIIGVLTSSNCFLIHSSAHLYSFDMFCALLEGAQEGRLMFG